jgi:hypothetical protein
MALLSGVVVPATITAKDKNLDNGGALTGSSSAPGALHPPVTSTLLVSPFPLDLVELALMLELAPHALRHAGGHGCSRAQGAA